MKKLPRKTKQWAKEAYDSLEKAITLFQEEYTNPTEEEKFQLFRYCAPFAGMNRNILDKEKIKMANVRIYQSIMSDIDNSEPDEPALHSISFLLAYIDAHISFGNFNEFKGDEIMNFLSENYDIDIPL